MLSRATENVMARIAVAGFRHASNRFTGTRSVLDDFERGGGWPPLARGDTLAAAVAGRDVATAGLLTALPLQGHEPVPLLWASAAPSGLLCRDTFEQIVDLLLDELTARGPVDAICLDLYGAMLVEGGTDGDAELVGRLRHAFGPELPLVAVLDRHADLSPALLDAATLLIGGECGAWEAGRRAAAAADRLLSARGAPWVRGSRRLSFAIPFDTAEAPFADAAARLRARERGTVAWMGLAAGFPFAGAPHAGPALFGWGSDRAALATALDAAAADLEARADAWRLPAPLDPDAAVREALRRAREGGGRTILGDVQDDPAGGGTGDSTGLLRMLIRHGAEGACIGLFQDPHVGTIASWAGVGAEICVSLGGKHGIPGDVAIEGRFRVEALVDAAVACNGRFYGGASLDLSPLVRLGIGGVHVVVVPRIVVAADRCLFAAVGIDVGAVPVLAIKCGRDAAGDLAGPGVTVVPVAAPGATPVLSSAALPIPA